MSQTETQNVQQSQPLNGILINVTDPISETNTGYYSVRQYRDAGQEYYKLYYIAAVSYERVDGGSEFGIPANRLEERCVGKFTSQHPDFEAVQMLYL